MLESYNTAAKHPIQVYQITFKLSSNFGGTINFPQNICRKKGFIKSEQITLTGHLPEPGAMVKELPRTAHNFC